MHVHWARSRNPNLNVMFHFHVMENQKYFESSILFPTMLLDAATPQKHTWHSIAEGGDEGKQQLSKKHFYLPPCKLSGCLWPPQTYTNHVGGMCLRGENGWGSFGKGIRLTQSLLVGSLRFAWPGAGGQRVIPMMDLLLCSGGTIAPPHRFFGYTFW